MGFSGQISCGFIANSCGSVLGNEEFAGRVGPLRLGAVPIVRIGEAKSRHLLADCSYGRAGEDEASGRRMTRGRADESRRSGARRAGDGHGGRADDSRSMVEGEMVDRSRQVRPYPHGVATLGGGGGSSGARCASRMDPSNSLRMTGAWEWAGCVCCLMDCLWLADRTRFRPNRRKGAGWR